MRNKYIYIDIYGRLCLWRFDPTRLRGMSVASAHQRGRHTLSPPRPPTPLSGYPAPAIGAGPEIIRDADQTRKGDIGKDPLARFSCSGGGRGRSEEAEPATH